MKISKHFKKLTIGSSVVEMKRTEDGVVHILADNFLEAQKGLGFAHAHDRIRQMLLGRILSSGKITELLFDTEEAFAIDFLVRKLSIQNVQEEFDYLSDEAKKWCKAYCEGVSTYIDLFGYPLLCKALKLPLNPWTVEDILIVLKLHLYFGLAQAQERIERFIIHAIHDGVNAENLKKIFSPHLNALDEEIIQLIQNLHLERPYLDMQLRFNGALSNNWALSKAKSLSEHPLCAFDPHLQVNRLPPFWYEAIMQTPQDFLMGITLPGFPGIVMGRSKILSASFTYGMMDTIDFFIEEVKEGQYLREEGFKPLIERKELITRKKAGKGVLKFFETDAGVIERKEAHAPIKDGLYLSLAWGSAKKGVFPTINAFVNLWSAQSASAAAEILRGASFSCNWVLADVSGNIAYQQSGKLPKRAASGLFPLPGWKKENLWQGFVEGSALSSMFNPECGFVASANDDKNQNGKPLSISVPYANYRYEYICRVLSEKKIFTVEELKALQCDLYSLQAEKFLEQIKDCIPNNLAGDTLRNWDLRYTKDSKAATLFEAFYAALLEEVFGKVFGTSAWRRIANHHSFLVFTHGNFDRLLLSEDETWYGEEGKKGCFKRVLEKTLSQFESEIPTWGKKHQFMMNNLLFNGKLPKFLGFDLGPIEMEGSRATVSASFIFHEKKRAIVTGATCRFISDLATQEAHTILAGGPSESRFSSYYATDVAKWQKFEYKKLKI